MPDPDPPSPTPFSAALLRGAALFALWLVVAGPNLLGLGFGLLAAGLGTWASLALLPPATARISPAALARVIAGVLRQSVLAGWDIARRALARDMRLAPGDVAVPLHLPPGAAQDGFRLLASLAPGALPLESGQGTLRLHVLDMREPHAAALARTERDVAAALGAKP
ncbi:Na+/H+ antiporter subunit E [Roseomonas sp. AR75]|uniref:Na+/H+ antiporter subunit E n=1 Tax=Roseomonas sp. AR75 TaxID=2562311 RepID=UPI0010C0B544|nr:Na+/H+ antiporter subunit E [Roseomonas sp. AR75]